MSEILAASHRVDAALDRPALLFLRHGETDWNRALRFQGQRDVPLNEIGRRQAARNGRAIAGILGAEHWRLVSSPLGRSIETMRIALEAARLAGRPFATDPVLKEAHYGDWEGLTLVEIGERYAEAARAREADKWGYVPPNGESYAMVAERVSVWLGGSMAPPSSSRMAASCARFCTSWPACRRTTRRTSPCRRTARSCSRGSGC